MDNEFSFSDHDGEQLSEEEIEKVQESLAEFLYEQRQDIFRFANGGINITYYPDFQLMRAMSQFVLAHLSQQHGDVLSDIKDNESKVKRQLEDLFPEDTTDGE